MRGRQDRWRKLKNQPVFRAPWAFPREPPPGLFTEPVFRRPDYAEALAISHVLELPRDLGFVGSHAAALFEPRADLFVGWPDAARAEVIQAPGVPVPGTSPVTRLVFRHSWVRSRPPLVAADNCFED